LNTPDIKYRRGGKGEVIEHVKFGKWKLQNWFYETPDINAWGIIYFGDRPNREVSNILESFQNQLPQVQFHFFSIDFNYYLKFGFLVTSTKWLCN
jgi:hypothetical protein